jgi:hypothetical protein
MMNILAIKTFNVMVESMLIKRLTVLFDQQFCNALQFMFVYIIVTWHVAPSGCGWR